MKIQPTMFSQVKIGQTFDFVSPNHMFNSFTRPVKKTAARWYQDSDGLNYKIGTLKAEVYHVGEFCPVCFGGHPKGCCAQDGHGG